MRTGLTLALSALLALPSTALAVPMEFTHQGRLLDSTGSPLASGDLLFSLYAEQSGGTALWSETHSSVALDAGFYSLRLGADQALDSSIFDGTTLWLEVSVDGSLLADRVAVVSVPYAVKAGVADNVSEDAVLNVSELQIGGTTVLDSNGLASGFGSDSFAELNCSSAGDVPTYDGSAWTCQGTGGKIDVARLEGTIGLGNLPVGTTSDHVAAGNHTHSAADVGALADTTTLSDLASKGLVSSNPAENCAEVLAENAGATDGFYWLASSDAPQLFQCDMTNGGFTRLSLETFDNNANGWSNTARTVCGKFGQILGGYNAFGQNLVVSRTYDLSAWPHTEVMVKADFIGIDSWDGENAEMKFDDTNVWTQSRLHTGGDQQCGVVNQGGWYEERLDAEFTADHTADALKVSFSSTLDQAANDESWGVDNVTVWVK